jgi:PKD repeat protein
MKTRWSLSRRGRALVVLATLTACSASSTSPSGPLPPTAVATMQVDGNSVAGSAMETFPVGTIVTLDGTKSHAAAGQPVLDFAWALLSRPVGSKAELTGTEVPSPQLPLDVPGDFLVQLVVSQQGIASAPVQMLFHAIPAAVSDCGTHAPVIANVTPNPAGPNTGQVVALSANVSDVDIDQCGLQEDLQYQWQLVSLPPQSQAKLNDAIAVSPSFAPDAPGAYVVSLLVTDSLGHTSKRASKTITVSSCGNAAPTIKSITPSSPNPLEDQVVTLKAAVDDADNAAGCALGQTFSYHWSLVTLPAGSKASLNDPAASDPSFEADAAGAFVVRLDVTDSTGRTGVPSFTTITAAPCGSAPPVIGDLIVSPASVKTGDTLTLGADVSDANADPGCNLAQNLTFAWTLVSAPVGSAATLGNAGNLGATLAPDVPGDYKLKLVVTDGNGISAQAERTISVATCGNAKPAISAIHATEPAPSINQRTTLSADVSDADASAGCGLSGPISYLWSITDAPSTSMAAFDDPTSATPSFTPDTAGTFKVSLVVTDGRGNSSTAATMSLTAAACGAAKPVIQRVFATPGVDPFVTLPGATPVQFSTTPVQLNATVVSADNAPPCNLNKTFKYAWTVVSLPSGSQAVLNSTTALDPSLIPFVLNSYSGKVSYPGDYIFTLQVTDSSGNVSLPATLSVNVPTCGSGFPAVLNIDAIDTTPHAVTTPPTGKGDGAGVPIHVNDIVQLDPTVFDADDACGYPAFITYAWSFIEVPLGSTSSLNAALESPFFKVDKAGEYRVRLVVKDVLSLQGLPHEVDFTVVP